MMCEFWNREFTLIVMWHCRIGNAAPTTPFATADNTAYALRAHVLALRDLAPVGHNFANAENDKQTPHYSQQIHAHPTSVRAYTNTRPPFEDAPKFIAGWIGWGFESMR